MAGPVTITCSGCGVAFPVPTRVLRVLGHQVWVRMDRSEVYGHMATCPGFAEPGSPEPLQEVSKAVAVPDVPKADLAGRINQFLDGEHYIARGGSRACTMCGTTGAACFEALKPIKVTTEDGKEGGRVAGKACCGACRDGNTHPAPGESRGTCAEWGAEHGAKN